MTRINLFRTTPATASSVAWGKTNLVKNVLDTGSPFVFAALLIACSLAVGCSSQTPQPASSTNQPIMQPTPQIPTTPVPAPVAPVQEAGVKPVHRRVVRKAPATVTYADKATGVSFQYPRTYALKTGDAATELISADPIPMDFTQPGGVPIAAVLFPGSAYPKTNLASAYFNVSVNKTLTSEQCGEFSVPPPTPATPSDPTVQATAQLSTPPISKLLIGDMELQSTETDSGGETEKGPRQESSKYYHVFQNGACYEFALKVSTSGVDSTEAAHSTANVIGPNELQNQVFHHLEKILATVKINPVAQAEVSAEAKANPASTPTETPAQ
jgi:hypothetical protein